MSKFLKNMNIQKQRDLPIPLDNKIHIHRWQWEDVKGVKHTAHILARNEYEAHETLVNELPQKENTRVVGLNRQPYYCTIDLISENEKKRMHDWLKNEFEKKGK